MGKNLIETRFIYKEDLNYGDNGWFKVTDNYNSDMYQDNIMGVTTPDFFEHDIFDHVFDFEYGSILNEIIALSITYKRRSDIDNNMFRADFISLFETYLDYGNNSNIDFNFLKECIKNHEKLTDISRKDYKDFYLPDLQDKIQYFKEFTQSMIISYSKDNDIDIKYLIKKRKEFINYMIHCDYFSFILYNMYYSKIKYTDSLRLNMIEFFKEFFQEVKNYNYDNLLLDNSEIAITLDNDMNFNIKLVINEYRDLDNYNSEIDEYDTIYDYVAIEKNINLINF